MDLAAGTHTATWAYVKDGSDSEGADRAWIDDVFLSVDAIFTSVEEPSGNEIPATYRLFQNYPNPFNPATTVSYAIAEPQHVSLIVYDALGRQVAVLVDSQKNRGRYEVRFDAQHLSGGIYHYELRAGSFKERKTMVVLR
jgi:hypothetical protein